MSESRRAVSLSFKEDIKRSGFEEALAFNKIGPKVKKLLQAYYVRFIIFSVSLSTTCLWLVNVFNV